VGLFRTRHDERASGLRIFILCILILANFLPLAALNAETDKTRRVLIQFCMAAGIFSAIVLGYALMARPLAVEEVGHCIVYDLQVPLYSVLAFTYVIAVVGSGFLVRRFWIQAFAALGLIGLIVSYLGFTAATTSVWCFFAAVLSLCVLMELRGSMRTRLNH
jgi:hypothetical protein